jgi:hypothetical protein
MNDCDDVDFRRANLDDSIGFRFGSERDFFNLGPLRVVGGADGSISQTEYNGSQRDFALMTGVAVGGADVDFYGFRFGFRAGAGPYVTSDGRTGASWQREASIDIPVRAGAAVRLSQRRSSLRVTETALMVMATSETAHARSPWEFSVAAGTTKPGRGPGGSLDLHQTGWQRLTVLRDWRSPSTQVAFTYTSTAQESRLYSDYRGYGGNQRGKTINGFGVGFIRSFDATANLSARLGAGIEVADWTDRYPLLVERHQQPMYGGIEDAITASGAVRYRFHPGLAFEATAQQVYWRALRLSEARWGIGIALTR